MIQPLIPPLLRPLPAAGGYAQVAPPKSDFQEAATFAVTCCCFSFRLGLSRVRRSSKVSSNLTAPPRE